MTKHTAHCPICRNYEASFDVEGNGSPLDVRKAIQALELFSSHLMLHARQRECFANRLAALCAAMGVENLSEAFEWVAQKV